jgi:asparagine synthase (glutamine-hydrolysing)
LTDEEKVVSKIKKYISEYLRNSISRLDRVGLALSAGVDSTILAYELYKQFRGDVYTYTVEFNETNIESSNAEKIARSFGFNFKKISISDIFDSYEMALKFVGYPSRTLWFFYVSREAKKDVEYIITGSGGDDLWMGYEWRYRQIESLKSNNPVELTLGYLSTHKRDPVSRDLLGYKFRGISDSVITNLFLPYFANYPKLDATFLSDYNGKLINEFIPIERKMSIINGVMNITPFLSKKMRKLAFAVPVSLKWRNEETKWILKKAYERELNLYQRPKIGFGPDPKQLWPQIRRKAMDLFEDSITIRMDYVNGSYLKLLLTEKSSPDSVIVNNIWSLIALETWLRLGGKVVELS